MVISKTHYICFLFSQSVASNSFATPWTVACQAPLFTEFPKQEYWTRLPFPSPGDFPHPGMELASPALASGFYYHLTENEVEKKKSSKCSKNMEFSPGKTLIKNQRLPGGSVVKNPPAMQEMWQELQFPFPGQEDSQGWEDPLEKEIATHFSILAWKILWTAHGVSES